MLITMIILGTLAVLLTIVYYSKERYMEDVFAAVTILSWVVFACVLLSVPLVWLNDRTSIAEFKSTKITIEQQRNHLERIQLTEAIIKNNAWLSKEKYNKGLFWHCGWMMADEINTLTPIE